MVKTIEKYNVEDFYFSLYRRTPETQEEFNRLCAIYSRWKELIKYHARLYHPLGEKRLEKYTTLDIDRKSPYIVLGSMDLLTEFAAYYLTTFGDCRYGFIKYDLKQFAFQYELDKALLVDDILFLTSSARELYVGNTQRVAYTNIIHATCSRKNDDQLTILLLEEEIKCFIDSKEYKVIDLYKLFNRRQPKHIDPLPPQQYNNEQVNSAGTSNSSQQAIEEYRSFEEVLRDNGLAQFAEHEIHGPALKNMYDKFRHNSADLQNRINKYKEMYRIV